MNDSFGDESPEESRLYKNYTIKDINTNVYVL